MTALAIGILLLLAFLHSFLGELFLIRPITSTVSETEDWKAKIPETIVLRIVRIGWHLGSVSWVSLAAVLYGVPAGIAVSGFALVGAMALFLRVRIHPAWPLMLILGYAGLRLSDHLPAVLELLVLLDWAIVGVAITVATGASVLHLYWAIGGTWGLKDAIPVVIADNGDSKSLFKTPTIATALVAFALLVLAGLIWVNFKTDVSGIFRIVLIIAAVLLGVRVLGDMKYVGFTKRIHKTRFGRLDSSIYTPLVVVLLMGALVALS